MILYEDQAADGPVREYGPHRLVTQCVSDRLGVDHWTLKHVEGVPKKGAGNIRRHCQRDPPPLGKDGRVQFAVYDEDKIREQVKLPFQACKGEVKQKLRGECPWGDRLVIVLLEKNIETVVSAICECAPSYAIAEETRVRAIRHKDLNARDIILKMAAKPLELQMRPSSSSSSSP